MILIPLTAVLLQVMSCIAKEQITNFNGVCTDLENFHNQVIIAYMPTFEWGKIYSRVSNNRT